MVFCSENVNVTSYWREKLIHISKEMVGNVRTSVFLYEMQMISRIIKGQGTKYEFVCLLFFCFNSYSVNTLPVIFTEDNFTDFKSLRGVQLSLSPFETTLFFDIFIVTNLRQSPKTTLFNLHIDITKRNTTLVLRYIYDYQISQQQHQLGDTKDILYICSPVCAFVFSIYCICWWL